MNFNELDQKLSVLLLGYIEPDFRPSKNESDTWRVINWMFSHNLSVDLQRLNPVHICNDALKYAILR